MHVREKPPLRLDIDVQTPDGLHFRWSDQEKDPAYVPTNLQFGSTMPGGFSELGCELPRKPDLDYSDLERLSTLTCRLPGGDIAWQGRLETAPRNAGDKMSVAPGCVGWQAHLEDRKDASMIYVDRDISRWGPMSRGLRQTLLTGGYGSINDPAIRPDVTNGLPSIVTGWRDAWNAKPYSGALYDSGAGNVIAAIYYDFVEDGGLNPADTGWELYLYARPNDDLTGTGGITSNLRAASAAGYFTPATAARFGAIEMFYNVAGAAGTPATDYTVTWRNLTVYGNHGLTKQGTDPKGFYGSDVVGHIITTWCPQLTYTTGSEGTIRADTFVIPHLTFNEGTTPGEMVRQTSRFGLPDWAVWENKTFYWAPRGTFGRNWRARVAPSKLSDTGPSVQRLWESIIVEYRDVDGTTKTVGPPGSGADTTDASLKDADTENPANKLGITRRDKLQMGTSTPAGAIAIGAKFLSETKALDTSGKAELVGHIEDDKGVVHPVSRVRAGDTITFVDASDPSARRIVAATYNHPTRTCQIDLDAPPQGLAALLERMGVVLVPLGLG